MNKVLEMFDKVIHWITFATDWVIYVAKIFKAIAAGVRAMRDNWPDRPVSPNAEQEKPTGDNSGNSNEVRDIPAHGEVLGGG